MQPSYRVISLVKILVLSLVVAAGVLCSSLMAQWLVYDDWLHRTGPLRVIGASIAAIITFAFVFGWQYLQRAKQQEMARRFTTIAAISDRIRNAVQIIACISFVQEPKLTQEVQRALAAIDQDLRGVLREVSYPVDFEKKGNRSQIIHYFRKSA